MIATPERLEAADKVPHAAPLHPAPDSAQVTSLFAVSFTKVAVNV
ncbi:MAG: hypothetical protein ABSH13_06100 [Candidatus Acidiferrum sp.]